MKKRIISVGVWIGIFMATVIVAYAITNLFFTNSETSEFSKKQIFRFNLDTGISSGEIGPGDSFSVSPVIYNDATEEMYVFLEIQMPEYLASSLPESGDSLLYTFDANEEWILVESGNGTVVYAYGSADMTALQPGESTSALTTQMTMKSITNAEYAAIDDINITITGYAMGTEGMSTIPKDAWNECKMIGNIQ